MLAPLIDMTRDLQIIVSAYGSYGSVIFVVILLFVFLVKGLTSFICYVKERRLLTSVCLCGGGLIK